MLGASIDKLRQTIDQLADAARALETEELVWSSHREQLVTLERERERLESVIGHLVSDAEARGASARDGRRSMADWLAVHTGQRGAITGSRAWLATRLRSMPETDAALSTGAITASHATVLTRAQNPRTQEAFERDERLLVDAARKVTADQLVQVVAHCCVTSTSTAPHLPHRRRTCSTSPPPSTVG